MNKDRYINISRLPVERKQKAWAWLKKNRPDLAELLGSEVVRELVVRFDAEVSIDLEDLK